MQEQVSQSTGEFSVEPPAVGPFGPRLRRAIVLLTVAVAAHLWFVRAPHGRTPSPVLPRVDITARATVEAAAPLTTPSEHAARRSGVLVKTEFISVGSAGTRGGSNLETPVSTMGMVRARSDMSPRERSRTVPDSPAPHRAAFVSVEAAPRPSAPDEVKVSGESSEGNLPLAPLALSARMEALSGDSSIPAVIPAVDRSAQLKRDEETVRRVLLDYTRAFERLDVQAAKALFPSVDDRALQRAFQRLDGQQLRFAACGVSVSGRDANARCRGDATYRPKVGSRILRLTEREWTFNLARDNDRWQIVNATLQ